MLQGLTGSDAQLIVNAEHPLQKISEFLVVHLHKDTSKSHPKEVWPHKRKKITQPLFDCVFTFLHYYFESWKVLNKLKKVPISARTKHVLFT
jgi:hypothetical protein